VVADDTLIKRVPLLNQFYVIEDVATAKAKIGQQNQWIKVMDAYGGEEGFVAAWFVSMEKKIPSTETQPSAPPQPAQPTPVIPLPEEDPDQVLIVFAAADGLAIRSEPVVLDTNLLKRVPVNSQFLVLEPAIQALAKLGVFNQWLNVKDATGMKGYVAAWFVTQKHQDPLGVVDQVVFSLPTQPLAKKSPVARKKSNLGSKKSNAVSKKPASAGKKSASASKISTTASKKSTSASTRSTLVIKKPTTASKKSSSASKKSTSVGKKSTSVSKKSPPSLKNN